MQRAGAPLHEDCVIEDRPLVREMFIASCGSIVPGAVVSGAGTGAQGMKLCSEVQPDLVFLDLVLPDGDGIDLVVTFFLLFLTRASLR